MEEFLTTKDIASLLKVNIITVRRWIDKRKLPAFKFDKDFRVKKQDFDKFLEERRVQK
jgi:excisionase family DNA binding protein